MVTEEVREMYVAGRKETLEKNIRENTKGILSTLIDYVGVQGEDWEKVKALAAEAHQRIPQNARWRLAAEQGYWPLILPGQREWQLYIDLNPGNAGSIRNGLNLKAEPNKVDVLQLATCLDQLDAKKVIKNLEEVLERRP